MSTVCKICVKKILYLVLILIPPVILAVFISRYMVNVPRWDQWELVPLLDKFYSHNLSFKDLFRQHNEHRLFFPLVIMVVMADLSKWNISWELAVNFLTAVGTFLVIVCQFQRTQGKSGGHVLSWPLCAISLLVFSLIQWENWLWGWQFQMLMNVFAVTAGLFLLCNHVNGRLGWIKIVWPIVLGVIASFSFSNGLLYWFIGLMILALTSFEGHKTKRKVIIVWLLPAIVVFIVFFYDYHKPQGSQMSLLYVFQHPVEYIKYILVFYGASVSSKHALVFGVLGIFVAVIGVILLTRLQHVQWREIAPYAAIGLYPLLSAPIVGAARLQIGVWQASSPRYTTFTILFWIANVIFLFFLIQTSRNAMKIRVDDDHLMGRKQCLTQKCIFVLSTVVLIVILSSAGLTSVRACKDFRREHRYLTPAREELFTLKNDDLQKRLYPSAEILRQRAGVLKKYKLSVYREGSDGESK